MASLFSFGRAQLAAVSRRRGPAPAAIAAHERDAPGLSAIVEREIIPRLVALHPRRQELLPAAAPTTITAEEIAAFTPLTLTAEADALLDFADALLDRGVPIEAVLVELLAPAARRLGEFWESDYCDFVDVTMGLWRLQEVVHELANRVPSVRRGGLGRRALFSAMPGDQHSFGAVVMDEIFTREGWLADRLTETTTPQLLARIAGDWFDLVGLTVSCDSHMGALPSLITAIRNVSPNPALCVMVGGRVFIEDPALVATVGADGTAPDARSAVRVAGRLVSAEARNVSRG